MAPSLAHFPDLCLDAIFKHVPLSDLLYSVGLICTNWYKSRRTELKKRRRLVLIADGKQETFKDYRTHLFCNGTELIRHIRRDDGSAWHTLESLEEIKFSTLSVPGGIQTIPFIASLENNFPNITRLHLNVKCSYSDLTEVIQQIGFFSEHLVELKLFKSLIPDNNLGNTDDDKQELADCLFAYLNSLQSLQHLQLDLILDNLRIRPEQMAWLSSLNTIAIRTYNNRIRDAWIFASLIQHSPDAASIEVYDNVNVVDIAQLDNELATKFTALSVTYGYVFDTMLRRFNSMNNFCTHFRSLTKLELQSFFEPMPVTMLARCLSLLTQLAHLDLQLLRIPPVEGALQEEEEWQVQQEITQVPSVRLLILSFSTYSHLDTERLFIAEIFPNLQVLGLGHTLNRCQSCEIDLHESGGFYRIEDTEPELLHRITECKRLARQPFRQCANLHTISLIDFFGNENLLDLDEM